LPDKSGRPGHLHRLNCPLADGPTEVFALKVRKDYSPRDFWMISSATAFGTSA
jgi:hypothetical protein